MTLESKQDTTRDKKALVLGATGGIGGEVARLLRERGWEVRALNRHPDKAARRDDGLAWIRGDAMHERDVIEAARGVSVIVHAVNPPGYRNWGQLVLPMIDNTTAAARACGARVVLPGTVYNYGPDAWPRLHESTAQHPETRKGRIRVEMEARLRAASREGVRTLIVRAGDFFGPHAANNWFSQGLIKPGQPVASISYPGRKGIGHQWAYLPDVAQTMVRLIEQDTTLGDFASFHMKGHWDEDGTQMTAAIQRAVAATTSTRGTPGREPKVRAFPWWLVTVGAPFVTLFREMKEMRYLWREPLYMDNTRLVDTLGAEPHTPFDDAVRATLEGLGCLAASASPQPRREASISV